MATLFSGNPRQVWSQCRSVLLFIYIYARRNFEIGFLKNIFVILYFSVDNFIFLLVSVGCFFIAAKGLKGLMVLRSFAITIGQPRAFIKPL
jgi:hypothetical protein